MTTIVELKIIMEGSWLRLEGAVLIRKQNAKGEQPPPAFLSPPCICVRESQKIVPWFGLTLGITLSLERISCVYRWKSNLLLSGFWSLEKLFVNIFFNLLNFLSISGLLAIPCIKLSTSLVKILKFSLFTHFITHTIRNVLEHHFSSVSLPKFQLQFPWVLYSCLFFPKGKNRRKNERRFMLHSL